LREQLRGVSYTVEAGEATVVCRKVGVGRGMGNRRPRGAGREGDLAKDLEVTKLVGFVERSQDWRVRERQGGSKDNVRTE
jgi:hypothetical protein